MKSFIKILFFCHSIEIFEDIDVSPINYKKLDKNKRLTRPQIIDSYSLFRLRIETEWELLIIGNECFKSSNIDDVKFYYGGNYNPTLIDVNSKFTKASFLRFEKKYTPYSPIENIGIKQITKSWRDKNLNRYKQHRKYYL